MVTGTVLAGAVSRDDPVLVSPAGLPARVRGIHAQNRQAERGVAGQRCALNLAGEGIGKEAIQRGDLVLAPELHAPTARIDAELDVLPGAPAPVGTWFPARLHSQTLQVAARIVPLAGTLAPGSRGLVQLVLARPVAAAVGDRIVLRDTSAQHTIGGGTFLDLRAPARRRSSAPRLAWLAASQPADPARALAGMALAPVPWPASCVTAACRRHGADAGPGRGPAPGRGWPCPRPPPRALPGPVGRVACFPCKPTRTWPESAANSCACRCCRSCPGRVHSFLRAEMEAGILAGNGAFLHLPGTVCSGRPATRPVAAAAAAPLGEGRFRPPRVRDLAGELAIDERVRRVLRLAQRTGHCEQIARPLLRPRRGARDGRHLVDIAAGKPQAGSLPPTCATASTMAARWRSDLGTSTGSA